MTRRFLNAALLSIAAATLVPSGGARAQLEPDSDQPIDITGRSLDIIDDVAIWTGDVRVVQGDSILASDRLEATMTPGGKINRITATGNVRYSNPTEAITGEQAVFENAERKITMTGDVLVTQGRQVMSAGAVTYWLDSGQVRFAPADGQRIRGVFYSEEDIEI